MTTEQAAQLLLLNADLIEWVKVVGFGCWGVGLAVVFAATWRG